jgi:hypothetical protein
MLRKNWLFLALGLGFTAMLTAAVPVGAQSSALSLGTIDRKSITRLASCPAGFDSGMTCYRGVVENCQSTVDLGFTYGVENPTQARLGTVVLLDGGGGTTPYSNPAFAKKYLATGYQIVYVAWDTPWEFTNGSTGNSIKNAACRPATFLNYVYQNVYQNVYHNVYNRGGLCAQGISAGSAAVAYSLAWYGSSSYLDNVELLSGPVFGDIKEGCRVPNPPVLEVCGNSAPDCNGAPWPDSPSYVSIDIALVARWSGQPSCNGINFTGASANAAWKAMSIVDGTDNPSFSYPQTSLAGWLCSNGQNNSAAQGDFFYQQFTSPQQTAGFSVTRIDNCAGAEGVSQGTTPQGKLGLDAITEHMISACVKRH